MPLLLIAAAVLYVLAIMAAWPIGLAQNLPHAFAFVSAGLLCALIAGVGPGVVAWVRSGGRG